MNHHKHTRLSCSIGLAAVTLLIISGCAGVKTPIKLVPDYHSRGITTITVMPIIDRRVEKIKPIDFDKSFYNHLTKRLEKKGYVVNRYYEFKIAGASIPSEQVADMSPGDLAALEPLDINPKMFLYIEDVQDNYIVLAYTFKLESTGSLISGQEKIELWRDKGIGSAGQGGLISGPLSGLSKESAVSVAVGDLLAGFPDVKKK